MKTGMVLGLMALVMPLTMTAAVSRQTPHGDVVKLGSDATVADVWPFLRKPGAGLADAGPLGIAPRRDGKQLTMRILRLRKL